MMSIEWSEYDTDEDTVILVGSTHFLDRVGQEDAMKLIHTGNYATFQISQHVQDIQPPSTPCMRKYSFVDTTSLIIDRSLKHHLLYFSIHDSDASTFYHMTRNIYTMPDNSSIRILFVDAHKSDEGEQYGCVAIETSKSGQYDIKDILQTERDARLCTDGVKYGVAYANYIRDLYDTHGMVDLHI